jgi:uncharacterized protein
MYPWTPEQGTARLTKNRRFVQPAENAFLDRATLRGTAMESDDDRGTVGRASAMRGCDDPPPPLLREGIAQFNRGEYFEQHETLELLWRAEPREVRRLYQGILQIGVAFHHLRRRNYHGTVYMLTRGARYLTPFSPRCQGVDVEVLLIDATTALRAVERLGPDRLGDFDWQLVPIVRFCSGNPL